MACAPSPSSCRPGSRRGERDGRVRIPDAPIAAAPALRRVAGGEKNGWASLERRAVGGRGRQTWRLVRPLTRRDGRELGVSRALSRTGSKSARKAPGNKTVREVVKAGRHSFSGEAVARANEGLRSCLQMQAQRGARRRRALVPWRSCRPRWTASHGALIPRRPNRPRGRAPERRPSSSRPWEPSARSPKQSAPTPRREPTVQRPRAPRLLPHRGSRYRRTFASAWRSC